MTLLPCSFLFTFWSFFIKLHQNNVKNCKTKFSHFRSLFYFHIFYSNEFLSYSILQDSMASTYEDQGPIPWYRTEQCIFYIVFFIVFPFFFVNIFVALIIVTFNELGEAELEDDMDKNQKSCIDFAIQAKPLQLYVPSETSGIR